MASWYSIGTKIVFMLIVASHLLTIKRAAMSPLGQKRTRPIR
jgi:hypothetical protein